MCTHCIPTTDHSLTNTCFICSNFLGDKNILYLVCVLVYTCRSACLSRCARVAVRCPVCMHGAAGTFKFEDNVASVAAVDHGGGCVVSRVHTTASQ